VQEDGVDREELMDEDGATELVDDEEMLENEGKNGANPMAALLASARAQATEYEDGTDDEDESEMSEDAIPQPRSKPDPSARAFSHLFPTVLDNSDVVLYVLDARDPLSTRSIATERAITAASHGSKRLILVLNKIDLVPSHVLGGWLKHLRRYHLTLPLRASAPAPNAKTFDHKGSMTQKATAETLLRALKAYAAKAQLKRALTVGVVGFPNVGKSSVINALINQLGGRKTTAAPTGAEAGVTTALRRVKLDKGLTLLDSPGVVFPASGDLSAGVEKLKGTEKVDAHAKLILLNALPPKAIHDPLPAIGPLLRRVGMLPDGLESLRKFYEIPPLMSSGGDIQSDFLVQVARKRGRLGKGGVPNLHAAAMGVLADWRDGRIGAWVDAPTIEVAYAEGDGDITMEGAEGAAEKKGDTKDIVKEWAKEFEIEGLWGGTGVGEEILPGS